jgi:predicted peptidase
MDGKTVFIPEIKLTKRVTPITSFLFIGSWESTAKATGDQGPLCLVDVKNNDILIKSPEKLLANSKAMVVDQDSLIPFLTKIIWGKNQATHIAFKIKAARVQPAVVELYTDSEAVLLNNGKMASRVSASGAIGAGGRGYLPVMLKAGENIINIKQYSRAEPRIQLSIYLDHSHDLQAAWQMHGGFLKSLVCPPGRETGAPELNWNQSLGRISFSLEVRNVSTNDIVIRKESVGRGKISDAGTQGLAPGIYQAVYRTQNDSVSECFIIGNPKDLLAALQEKLSKYNLDSESKLDIEVQLRRARFLLSEDNYNILDRQWQEKIAYTFSCLDDFERSLNQGATNIAKDQPGLHIRGFASGADGSTQSYKIFIPSNYNPGTPLPLLVIAPVRIANKTRPFIEGPVMANHRQALLWTKFAEKYGFALLWPGYRGIPEGCSYESVHIDEAIKAVEKDYTIDRCRISVYGTCSAGFNAGRLIEEYPNRFAAIVYDRAIIDLSLDTIRSFPPLMEWYTTVNPSRHVIDNKNIKIFVLHDGTRPPGHGPVEYSIAFLEQAKETRGDVVNNISTRPMTLTERMDTVFSWLEPCRNANPDGKRSQFLAKSGYTGPIMEIFAAPILVVEGTHATGGDRENIQRVIKSLQEDYTKYFHGAKCTVKTDSEVTEDDIDTYSLILVGNPQSNSVWAELQPKLPITMTPTTVAYGDDKLAGFQPFQAIVRHPTANDKYVLLIGAGNLKTMGKVMTDDLFTAWYDCFLYSPDKIISKLDSLHDLRRSR